MTRHNVIALSALGLSRAAIAKRLEISWMAVERHINPARRKYERDFKERRGKQFVETLKLLAGGQCTSCGYNRCLPALHFHHIDPFTKKFQLGTARHRSLKALEAEAKKCKLLCANCHIELETANRKEFYGQERPQ